MATTVLLVAVIAAVAAWFGSRYSRQVQIPSQTGYHAVFLNNNMIMYGKLRDLGTQFPRLTDVYYIRTDADPNSKNVASRLVKRGSEWHGPDQMTINAANIMFVEPVSSGTKISALIRDMEESKEIASKK